MKNTLNLLLHNTQKAFNKKDYSLALSYSYKASKITGNTIDMQKLLTSIQKPLLAQGQIAPNFQLPHLQLPWSVSPSLLISCMLLFLLKFVSSVYKKTKISSFYIISCISFLIATCFIGYKQYHFYFSPQALNLQSQVGLHLAPKNQSPLIGKIKYIQLLRVKKIKNNWALVQAQGQVGWIPLSLLFFTNFQSLDTLWEL